MSPPTHPDYSLILLKSGDNKDRMARAVKRTNKCTSADAIELLNKPLPLLINPDLSHTDALLGQFELICCDSVSVFISTEVIEQATSSYLDDLYQKLLESSEFSTVLVTILNVPMSEQGRRFLDQFTDIKIEQQTQLEYPLKLQTLHKKARIMSHWANRIGVKIGE